MHPSDLANSEGAQHPGCETVPQEADLRQHCPLSWGSRVLLLWLGTMMHRVDVGPVPLWRTYKDSRCKVKVALCLLLLVVVKAECHLGWLRNPPIYPVEHASGWVGHKTVSVGVYIGP